MTLEKFRKIEDAFRDADKRDDHVDGWDGERWERFAKKHGVTTDDLQRVRDTIYTAQW